MRWRRHYKEKDHRSDEYSTGWKILEENYHFPGKIMNWSTRLYIIKSLAGQLLNAMAFCDCRNPHPTARNC